jgi:hypothetical protein
MTTARMASKRKSPDRMDEDGPRARKGGKADSEEEIREKRRLRAAKKTLGSPDYSVDVFKGLEFGLPPIQEEGPMDADEIERMLAPDTPPPSQSQSPPWKEVERKKKGATNGPRKVPQGSGQGTGDKKAGEQKGGAAGGYKIPKLTQKDGGEKDGARKKENDGEKGPGGSGSYAAAAAARSSALVLWVYEGQTTKVPIFFEIFAPFQEALGAALEEAVWGGRMAAGLGLDEAVYHKKSKSIKLTCANAGSIQLIKDIVSGLRVADKIFRAWGVGEEPSSFDMVAYLGIWQRTPLERFTAMLAHSNPGIPLQGCEALAVWEQERSRKVDLKADQAFYDYVRGQNWRLKYVLGYADCFMGKHGMATFRQEQVRRVFKNFEF